MPTDKVTSSASIMLQGFTKHSFSFLGCEESRHIPDSSLNQLTASDRAHPSWWGTNFIFKALQHRLKDSVWKTLLVGCVALGLISGVVLKLSGLFIILLLFLSLAFFFSFSSHFIHLSFSPLSSSPFSFSFFFQSLAMQPKLTLNFWAQLILLPQTPEFLDACYQCLYVPKVDSHGEDDWEKGVLWE